MFSETLTLLFSETLRSCLEFSEALRSCLVFSGALRFGLENCPPETGGTRSNATEGVDSYRPRPRLNYTAHRLSRKAPIFSDFN